MTSINQQLEWLDKMSEILSDKNSEVIRDIKENLLAVRLMETAAMKESEIEISRPKEVKVAASSVDSNYLFSDDNGSSWRTERGFDAMIKTMGLQVPRGTFKVSLPYLRPGETVEVIDNSQPIKKSGSLNTREKELLETRIKSIEREIQVHLHTKKQFRKKDFVQKANERINTLKGWLN